MPPQLRTPEILAAMAAAVEALPAGDREKLNRAVMFGVKVGGTLKGLWGVRILIASSALKPRTALNPKKWHGVWV